MRPLDQKEDKQSMGDIIISLRMQRKKLNSKEKVHKEKVAQAQVRMLHLA